MEVRAKVLSLAALALSSLLIGCTVGEYGAGGSGTDGKGDGTTPDASGNTGGNDETSFTIQIKPLAAEAGCTGCHGGQMPTLTSWAMLQPKYKNKAGAAVLVTKGPHSGSPYFNDTQKAAVQAWVNGLSQ